MANKVQTAYYATRDAELAIDDAKRFLSSEHHGTKNAMGVYMNPGREIGNVNSAILRLQEAVKLQRATAWPSEADYDTPDHANDF